MFIRFLLGAVISTAVLFMWGFAYWAILPFSNQVMTAVPNEDDLRDALRDDISESGVFVVPYPATTDTEDPAWDRYLARHREGPIAMLFVRREGGEPMPPSVFAWGLVHNFLAAAIGGILLAIAAPRAYLARVMLLFWVGVFTAVWVEFSDVVWYSYPVDYFWLRLVYHVISATLIGLIMGIFVRPTSPSGA